MDKYMKKGDVVTWNTGAAIARLLRSEGGKSDESQKL